MTVYQLHKLLGQLIEQGHKRSQVVVDKRSFTSPLEQDGHILIDVEDCQAECHAMLDDDGGTKINKDGSERIRTSIVLKGGDPHHTAYWCREGYRVEQDDQGNWTRLVPFDAQQGGEGE